LKFMFTKIQRKTAS